MTTQFTEAPIFDADQHMYETPDSLTKYLPEKYSRAVQFAQFGRQTRIVINNRVNDFIPNPTFERVAAPGAHEKFFAGENTEGLTLREMQGPGIDAPAATRNPVARVAELDRQGVVEVLNYPTLASLIEHATADDPELTLAVIHALNQWMLEHWTYNYEKPRVLDADHQSLGSRRRTARARVPPRQRRQGRIDQTRAGQRYSGWRSPALPEFDPFWRDVEAAGPPIVLHASYPPLDDYVAKWEPPHTQNFMAQSAFRWMVLGHREVADMITSLICHGTLTASQDCASPVSRTAVRGSTRCSVTSKTCTGRCRRISPSIRTTCSGATSGSARSGRGASPTSSRRSAGTESCSDRTTPSRRPGRTEGILEVRRRHGCTSYLRLHGRQRAPVHGSADRQPRPRRRQAACHGERVTSKVR